jgi:hypothetical protein
MHVAIFCDAHCHWRVRPYWGRCLPVSGAERPHDTRPRPRRWTTTSPARSWIWAQFWSSSKSELIEPLSDTTNSGRKVRLCSVYQTTIPVFILYLLFIC